MSERSVPSGPDALHVMLVGEMGVGKSTVGRLVADMLGREFRDSDLWLETAGGRGSAAIAAEEGVSRLHELEVGAFLEMVLGPPSVVAVAASVVESAPVRDILDRQLTVWLRAPAEIVEERCKSGTHRRSVEPEERESLLSIREPLFERVSRLVIDTGRRDPVGVAAEVVVGLALSSP